MLFRVQDFTLATPTIHSGFCLVFSITLRTHPSSPVHRMEITSEGVNFFKPLR